VTVGDEGKKILNFSDKYQKAYIHPQADLGKNVEVGPFSTIGPNVKVGDNTKIGSHVML